MLKVKNLWFKHRSSQDWTLKDISFEATPGEVTVILGANGSGKSTLFKCISGIWKPQKGSIFFRNEEISSLKQEKRILFFSMVPQDHTPPFNYSVEDVVLTGRARYIDLFSTPGEKDLKKVSEVIEFLGLTYLRKLPYTMISGGERQLALIARALAQEAPIMLLDEPTSHLDFKNQVEVLKKVKLIAKKQGLTTLITLHDPNHALAFADKVVLLKSGEVFAEGSPREIITSENLEKIYQVKVNIYETNGKRFVYPVLNEGGER